MLPGLRQSLAEALPGDQVEVEAQQGRIHLSGVVASDAAADEAAKLAGMYSKDVVNSLVVDPRHLPQMQLQVRIAEIDRSKLTPSASTCFGLNGNEQRRGNDGAVLAVHFPDAKRHQQAMTSDFLNLFYFNIKHGVGRDHQGPREQRHSGDSRRTQSDHHSRQAGALSGGRTVSLSHHAARGRRLRADGNRAIPPYGVKLEFTPFVNSDGTIRLKVAPEVSALDYTNEVVIAGYALPALFHPPGRDGD